MKCSCLSGGSGSSQDWLARLMCGNSDDKVTGAQQLVLAHTLLRLQVPLLPGWQPLWVASPPAPELLPRAPFQGTHTAPGFQSCQEEEVDNLSDSGAEIPHTLQEYLW